MPETTLPQTPIPRLLLVSNRLPVSIKRSAPHTYAFSQGTGGLVTGLSGLSQSADFRWYGWPGLEVPSDEHTDLSDRLREGYGAIPVFLEDELADLYYNGFSSELDHVWQDSWADRRCTDSILWPLIHYHPGEITFREDAWNAYQEVNRLFARAIARDVQQGDLVWIHDFHLMLLPAMLREELGRDFDVKIGFFLHTPFPSSEVYRILPVRKEILMGVLESDLVGFHTNGYGRHFLSACSHVLYVAPHSYRSPFEVIYLCHCFLFGFALPCYFPTLLVTYHSHCTPFMVAHPCCLAFNC